MATANQEIVYRVSVDNKQAVEAFNAIAKSQEGVTKSTQKMHSSTQQGNMLLMSTSRIVQDLPFGFMAVGNNITFLTEQFAMAKAQGIGFTAALKSMFTSLMGTGGIVFAISATVSILTTLSTSSKQSTKEMETFADVLERAEKSSKSLVKEISRLKGELKDISNPSFWQALLASMTGGNMGDVVAGNIQSGDYVSRSNQLRELNKEKDHQNRLTQIAINLTNGEAKSISEVVKQNMLRNKDLTFMRSYLEDELEKIPKVSEHYKEYAKALELVNSQLVNSQLSKPKQEKDNKGLVYDLNDINAALKEILDTVLETDSAMGKFLRTTHGKGIYGRFNMGTVKPGKDLSNNGEVSPELRSQILKENAFFIDSARDMLGILRGEFSTFWADVFGEANSLFEKFIQSIAENLFQLGANRVAGFFLDMLMPGLGEISGLGGSVSRPQIINVNLGNETLARAVVKGNYEAQRLRLTN